MGVGLAVLETSEAERVGERATELSAYLRGRLREALREYEMVKDVRGERLFNGIAFRAPRSLNLRLGFSSFNQIHPAVFGQVLVMRLFRDHGILTQICGNDFMVLKLAPLLIVSQEQVDEAISSVKQVVELAHSPSGFWTEALGLARRVMNV